MMLFGTCLVRPWSWFGSGVMVGPVGRMEMEECGLGGRMGLTECILVRYDMERPEGKEAE